MSARPPHLYLVCYDICGPDDRSRNRRWRQVYDTLRAHGEHIQYSVFRCVLTDNRRAELEGALLAVIEPSLDQVLIVPLGRADADRTWRMYALGRRLDPPERVAIII